jgi:AhpD family alkylhydroperoxidase
MSRLQPLELDTAPEPQRSQLAAVKQKLGGVPNLLRTFATSPNVLEAYLGFSGALGKTDLDGALVESVALTVAGVNGCEYCAAAHTAIGKGQGLGADAAAAPIPALRSPWTSPGRSSRPADTWPTRPWIACAARASPRARSPS